MKHGIESLYLGPFAGREPGRIWKIPPTTHFIYSTKTFRKPLSATVQIFTFQFLHHSLQPPTATTNVAVAHVIPWPSNGERQAPGPCWNGSTAEENTWLPNISMLNTSVYNGFNIYIYIYTHQYVSYMYHICVGIKIITLPVNPYSVQFKAAHWRSYPMNKHHESTGFQIGKQQPQQHTHNCMTSWTMNIS